MVFQPSLDQELAEGFYAQMEGLVEEIFGFATLVPRVAAHLCLPDYHSDVEEVRESEGAMLSSRIEQRHSVCSGSWVAGYKHHL